MQISFTIGLALMCLPLRAAMPASEQNALVKRYCTVCHTDMAMNGGLSLEHYDAAKRDPTLAVMILSKLRAGAIGAAGLGVPDKAAQEAWLNSTKEQAAGSAQWFVDHEGSSTSASIVRQVGPGKPDLADSPVYRLKIVCNPSSGVGAMQLSWSPRPQTGRSMTASADGKAPVEYSIEGKESMGNGATVQTGRGAVVLSEGVKLSFPNRILTVRELFPGESVDFPLSDLDEKTRAALSSCF
jgi:hypothetical protein